MGFADVVLGFLLVTRGGDLLKHALGVLLLAWRRMLLAGAAALVGGLLVGEMAAVVATSRIPPPLMAQVVIAIFAVILAYAASMTVFLEELLHGIIATIRLIEGDVAAGARTAAVIAEREAGEVGTGLMRLFGAQQKPNPATTKAATAAPQSLSAAVATATRGGATGETEDAIAATEEFAITAPRPRVDARPVRADQLPRIGWAAEATEAGSGAALAATAPAAPSPPLPEARSSVQASPLPPLPVRTSSQPLPPPAPQEDMPPPASAAAPAPGRVAAEETGTSSRRPVATEQAPGEEAADAFGAQGRPTRPLSRPNSQPLAPGEENSAGLDGEGTPDA